MFRAARTAVVTPDPPSRLCHPMGKISCVRPAAARTLRRAWRAAPVVRPVARHAAARPVTPHADTARYDTGLRRVEQEQLAARTARPRT